MRAALEAQGRPHPPTFSLSTPASLVFIQGSYPVQHIILHNYMTEKDGDFMLAPADVAREEEEELADAAAPPASEEPDVDKISPKNRASKLWAPDNRRAFISLRAAPSSLATPPTFPRSLPARPISSLIFMQ